MHPEWICNNGAVYEGERHENEQSPPCQADASTYSGFLSSFDLRDQSLLHAVFCFFKAASTKLVDKVSAVRACLAALSGKCAFSHTAFDPKPVAS
jgi:hypothetical protein